MKRSLSILARELWHSLLLRLGLAEAAHYINGPETLPAPLSREEEKGIFIRLEQDDPEAKQQLIVHNLRLVVYIARKFESSGLGVEDLISIGTIGLIKAVNTFCPSRGIKLATYASRCIENEILMYFRNRKKSAQDVYISDPIDTDKDGNALTLQDIMADDTCIFDDIELRLRAEQLHRCIEQSLAGREREIVVLRYGLNGKRPLTQREVASRLEISRSYVSRLEKKALEKLRAELEKCGK